MSDRERERVGRGGGEGKERLVHGPSRGKLFEIVSALSDLFQSMIHMYCKSMYPKQSDDSLLDH